MRFYGGSRVTKCFRLLNKTDWLEAGVSNEWQEDINLKVKNSNFSFPSGFFETEKN